MTLERRLSAENRKLSCAVEKESNEKKKLSMEVEELHWKIQSQSLSLIEGPTYEEQEQGKTGLSCSFTEGYSLPAKLAPNSKLPQVKEIVEKHESVSWKIEYQDQEDEDLNLQMRVYVPDLEKMKRWTPPKAEKVLKK